MNVLISGIAGDIGFGAGRILRDWGWSSKLFGIDTQAEHPGDFVFDHHAISPRATDPVYLDWLTNHIKINNVGLFIPTSEAEIRVLNDLSSRTLGGARILLANHQAISQSLDKQACMCFLSERGIRVPRNGIVGEITPEIYPVVVKPRFGQGSKQVQRIEDLSMFKERAVRGHVWQEYLSPEDQEYTCAIYSSDNRGVLALVIRRALLGGLTGRGEVVNNPVIERYVINIAHKFELKGAINVQLRLTSDGPCLFEVNPRLSSTLVFRDKMGFNDLRWWIQDLVSLEQTPELPPYHPPTPGTRFYRMPQEYIVFK